MCVCVCVANEMQSFLADLALFLSGEQRAAIVDENGTSSARPSGLPICLGLMLFFTLARSVDMQLQQRQANVMSEK